MPSTRKKVQPRAHLNKALSARQPTLRLCPLSQAVALALAMGTAGPALADGPRPFSSEWFNAARPNAAHAGAARAPGTPPPLAEQQRALQAMRSRKI